MYNPENPLIVQSDRTMLLEVNNALYEEARDFLSQFAELEKSPEYIHTYKISPLSLWNAAASGMAAQDILDGLDRYTKFDIPGNIKHDISDYIARYGRVKLIKDEENLLLTCENKYLMEEIWHSKSVKQLLGERVSETSCKVTVFNRGHLKQALIKIGFPVEDLAGYVEGAKLQIGLRGVARSGTPFALRDYQQKAVDMFHAGGAVHGGSGVIVLPCGAGKTVVGLGTMQKLQCETLILSTNITAVRQWIEEIVDKTDVPRDMIGEYTGEMKQIKPITVTTYQILTYRKKRDEEFPHFGLFDSKDWGLIIYDEVHLLPAEVFRITAQIQARRRLGLTATLVREDGREDDVFSLVGPKKYDLPWKELESKAWIATAHCTDIRVPLSEDLRLEYAVTDARNQFRIAAENPMKKTYLARLLEHHKQDQTLIIGVYVRQLTDIAKEFRLPLITGKTPNLEREELYASFKLGKIKCLVVSKVANFAVDLPDANVAIEVCGTFGSRQEEAQRLGRILRPKDGDNTAHFYALVTKDTKEQEFAAKRQLFLTEQGYRYTIVDGDEFLRAEKVTYPSIGKSPRYENDGSKQVRHLRIVK
jgi:DNA excision repair protein ERCC-3